MGLMCKVLGVSRSGFYVWLGRDESDRARANRDLAVEIKKIHEESLGTYGSPRVHAELRRRDHACGKNRVARIMQEEGVRGKCRRRQRPRTTDSNHNLPIAENLVKRDFSAENPNQLWLADITYIPTEEGWLYLASIIDVFSRKIVGWAMEDHMRAELTLAALRMAIEMRCLRGGLVHHSDRGSQYASKLYQDALEDHGIACSMSSVGNCYDNALKESFFHTLKVERIHGTIFRTKAEAKSSIFEYIEGFYNRRRLHSALGYRTPSEVEKEAA